MVAHDDNGDNGYLLDRFTHAYAWGWLPGTTPRELPLTWLPKNPTRTQHFHQVAGRQVRSDTCKHGVMTETCSLCRARKPQYALHPADRAELTTDELPPRIEHADPENPETIQAQANRWATGRALGRASRDFRAIEEDRAERKVQGLLSYDDPYTQELPAELAS